MLTNPHSSENVHGDCLAIPKLVDAPGLSIRCALQSSIVQNRSVVLPPALG